MAPLERIAAVWAPSARCALLVLTLLLRPFEAAAEAKVTYPPESQSERQSERLSQADQTRHQQGHQTGHQQSQGGSQGHGQTSADGGANGQGYGEAHGEAHGETHPAAQASAGGHGASAGHAGGQQARPPEDNGALCQGFGPQTPRDIGNGYGLNPAAFSLAPPPEEMNLCNIHTHTNAEHLGPGFSIYAGPGEHGGFKCAGSGTLSEAELSRPRSGNARFEGVAPGDTIEVHWVYSSCAVAPGPGLGACLSDACANPELRVEAQVFLVVNDRNALDFRDFIYFGTLRGGRYQARSLPTGTGTPVVFRGSTTGPNYSQQVCSPLQVTWSVRPRCARLDIATLDAWASMGNVFEETHSHGVRRLVTAPALLSPID